MLLVKLVTLFVISILCYAMLKTKDEVLERRYGENPNLFITLNFWKNFMDSPTRASAVFVFLVCQNNIICMILAIAVMFGISYYLAMNDTILISWFEDDTNMIINVISMAIAFIFAINMIVSMEEILSIIIAYSMAELIVLIS